MKKEALIFLTAFSFIGVNKVMAQSTNSDFKVPVTAPPPQVTPPPPVVTAPVVPPASPFLNLLRVLQMLLTFS